MTASIDALIAAERLPRSYVATVDRWWRPLARELAQWRREAGHPLIVGINGAQGSGKSTLCRFLEAILLPELGLSVVTLSLDDLYLTLAERLHMARAIHPLFRTRGVPGTHDAALGISVLDDLVAGRDTSVPRFSKALDDRMPRSDWAFHRGGADIVLFEGWCVGATSQDTCDLEQPINVLEAEADSAGIWRRHVNASLEGIYADWFARINRLVMLRPPTFECVLRNRLLQEHKLRAVAPDAPGIMDDDGVRYFVSHYERLTQHMLANLPNHADILFDLDEQQDVVAARGSTHNPPFR